jgi:hypothetical protein
MRAMLAEYPAPAADRGSRRLGSTDIALLCVFLIGLYTHYTPQISATIPFPSAPAGIAGLIMLWRQRTQITTVALTTLLAITLLYLLSVLSATDLSFLARRFNGFVQLLYSIVVGYGAFLTLAQASRRQMATLFLSFSLVILVGCLLEDYGGFRPISDAIRERLYSSGVYDADLRDEMLYGRVRPKFFASEPASVTFTYSFFTFIWMVTSRWRWKLVAYFILMGLGAFAMPGPTLLLMLLLIMPYELFLAGRKSGPRGGHFDLTHLLKIVCLGVVLLGAFAVAASSIFSERLKDVTSGNDASFFYRVRGPSIAARYVFEHYPIAGAGLTGEPYIEAAIENEYLRSPAYSRDWPIVHPATELVINFFFLHWIYLGVVWGSIMFAAMAIWLKSIGIPSAGFCLLTWTFLGQASGAYVGPLAWAVLYLAGAAAVANCRTELTQAAPQRYQAGVPRWQGLRVPRPTA